MECYDYYLAYKEILEEYLRTGEESFLFQAFNLGKRMLKEGYSVDFAAHIHLRALGALEEELIPHQEESQTVIPFLEVITSFGMSFQDMIRVLMHFMERVNAAGVEWEASFNAITDLILIIDFRGCVIRANKAFCELLRKTDQEITGQPCWILFYDTDEPPEGCQLPGCIPLHQYTSYDVYIPKLDRYYTASINPIHGFTDLSSCFVYTMKDITERRKAEEALRESEKRLSQIVQGSSAPAFVVDNRHFVTHWNKACENLTGVPASAVIGSKKPWSAFYPVERPVMADLMVDNAPEEEVARYYEDKYRKSALIESAYEAEDFYPNLGESGKWLFFTAAPLIGYQGKVVGAIETLQDITEHKRAEDQIKASLKEKELLLLEIHHRVKDNLQVVSSLLNMQARATKDKDKIDILTESKNRINAMALLHTQLYESENISGINMKRFVDNLLRQLLLSYPIKNKKITPVANVVDYPFPMSTAMPIGLLVNELLTNALKHAFVNREEGKIKVILTVSENGVVTLTVSDDGIGLPERVDINTSKTLGLRLVKILVEDQLRGNLEVIREGGTTFNIEFMKEKQMRI